MSGERMLHQCLPADILEAWMKVHLSPKWLKSFSMRSLDLRFRIGIWNSSAALYRPNGSRSN